MKSISLPPRAHTLISATRHIGYSLESAIADLVDNSIAANARQVSIDFNDINDSYIAILDDGCGMSATELNNAMQYGSADPSKVRDEKDLGRYGLGLKTASMSQCRKLTVVSKKGGCISARQWDLGYIERHKDEVWPLLELDDREIRNLPLVEKLDELVSGTLVIWQDIDFGGTYDETTFDDEINKATEHLSLVFHRYLFGENGIRKLHILVNNRMLKPKDPFLQYVEGEKHGDQSMANQALGKGNEKIEFRAFMLPHEKELTSEMRLALGTKKTLKRTQGFYIYRNKRLITYGDWFGLKAQGEFFKLARVKVDIPNSLDIKWSLDVKKSVAIPPKQIISHLRAYVDKVVKQSRKRIRIQVFGKTNNQQEEDVQVWEPTVLDGDVTSVLINRKHSVIKTMLENGSLNEKILKLLEHTIPIEYIYCCRSNEQHKIANEVPLTIEEMVEMLKGFVSTVPKGIARKQALKSMLFCEPFILSAATLSSFEKEILGEA